MTTFTSGDQARAYILNHDADVKRWDRQSKTALANLVLGRMSQQNMIPVVGPHKYSKDELVNWLADDRYPDVQAARDAYYAAIGA
jgi:hypothetical protein